MTVARRRIAQLSGYSTTTSCKVVVVSLYPGDITVSCNGSNYNVVLTAFGNDRGTPVTVGEGIGSTSTAGYSGSTTVTGLTSNKKYLWTASQTQNGATETETSYLWSNANPYENTTVYLLSCFRGDDATNTTSDYGAFSLIDYENASHFLMFDDVLYPDQIYVDDSAGTGHISENLEPDDAYTKYDYALAWMSYLGLLEDSTKAPIRKGRDEYVRAVFDHMNIIPQWGDHEFTNNRGWDNVTNVLDAHYLSPKAVWDAIFLPLQPPCRGSGISSADAVANHWGIDIGCARFVSPDRVTNGNGTAFLLANAETSTLWGTNQVSDLRAALKVESPAFKCFLSTNDVKYMQDLSDVSSTINISDRGGQQSMSDCVKLEYRGLVTDETNGVLASNYCNGTFGNFIWLNGDFHSQVVKRMEKPAYAGNVAEEFLAITIGPASSLAIVQNDAIVSGLVYDGATIDYIRAPYEADNPTAADRAEYYGCAKITLYGSQNPKKMVLQLLHKNGIGYSRQWVQYLTDNLGASSDDTIDFPNVSSGGE